MERKASYRKRAVFGKCKRRLQSSTYFKQREAPVGKLMELTVCIVCDDTIEKTILRDDYPDCGHEISFCCDCVKKYVSIKIDERAVKTLRCPFPGCQELLLQSHVKQFSSDEGFDRYMNEHDILQKVTPTFRGEIFTDIYICLTSIWRRSTLDSQRCPRCRFVIEKDGGCSHMTCSRCAFEFYWCCRHEYGNHNNNLCELNKAARIGMGIVAAVPIAGAIGVGIAVAIATMYYAISSMFPYVLQLIYSGSQMLAALARSNNSFHTALSTIGNIFKKILFTVALGVVSNIATTLCAGFCLEPITNSPPFKSLRRRHNWVDLAPAVSSCCTLRTAAMLIPFCSDIFAVLPLRWDVSIMAAVLFASNKTFLVLLCGLSFWFSIASVVIGWNFSGGVLLALAAPLAFQGAEMLFSNIYNTRYSFGIHFSYDDETFRSNWNVRTRVSLSSVLMAPLSTVGEAALTKIVKLCLITSTHLIFRSNILITGAAALLLLWKHEKSRVPLLSTILYDATRQSFPKFVTGRFYQLCSSPNVMIVMDVLEGLAMLCLVPKEICSAVHVAVRTAVTVGGDAAVIGSSVVSVLYGICSTFVTYIELVSSMLGGSIYWMFGLQAHSHVPLSSYVSASLPPASIGSMLCLCKCALFLYITRNVFGDTNYRNNSEWVSSLWLLVDSLLITTVAQHTPFWLIAIAAVTFVGFCSTWNNSYMNFTDRIQRLVEGRPQLLAFVVVGGIESLLANTTFLAVLSTGVGMWSMSSAVVLGCSFYYFTYVI